MDFPSHYVVVVGYDTDSAKSDLIVNNGLGDNFQRIDTTDPKVRPAKIYWLNFSERPDGDEDGDSIGPATNKDWVNVDAKLRLEPTIVLDSDGHTTTWRHSDSTRFIIGGSNLAVNKWFD